MVVNMAVMHNFMHNLCQDTVRDSSKERIYKEQDIVIKDSLRRLFDRERYWLVENCYILFHVSTQSL